jgi:hypothetical protein
MRMDHAILDSQGYFGDNIGIHTDATVLHCNTMASIH